MVENLKLFKLVDGVQTPFPNEDSQVEIFDYTYNAKRMGGAPSISATVKYANCLDDVWTESVYAEFNGEKYFLKQTPTSSYSSDDARYKHDLELVSERIILDNVYFYDVVSADFNDYKPVTDSTKVIFFGNISEFVARLNESLKYAKLQKVENGTIQGYNVVIDNGITSEAKLITFEDQFFSGVLQEIFKVYELPYYFVGKTIHIGFEPIQGVVMPTFQYGIDNELLSITKTNANNKIVNRVTGQGSADNIPYYYPNMSEKGDLEAKYYSAENGAVLTDKVRIINGYLYGKKIDTGSSLEFRRETSVGIFIANTYKYSISSERGRTKYNYSGQPLSYKFPEPDTSVIISFERDLQITSAGLFRIPIELYQNGEKYFNSAYITELKITNKSTNESLLGVYHESQKIHTPRLDVGTYTLSFIYQVPYMGYITTQSSDSYTTQLFMGDVEDSTVEYWYDSHKKVSYTSLTKVGLKLNEGVTPQVGNVIIQELVGYIQPQETLMPSIYRESEGVERFYNAINDTYVDDEGNDIEFNNPYIDGKPKEQIVQFEDIKPTITGITNYSGQRIDMFSEFAYDENDNDEMEEINGSMVYKHPYFFAKLRKMNGKHSFNLFDSAIDEGEMTISMTSGHCGGCNFRVMVSEDDLKQNTVQVYETDVFDSSGKIIHKRGDLKRDEKGNVICGRKNYQSPVTGQDMQQDTINNEVWIALEKDLETYGTMMPSRVVNDDEQETAIRPSTDDTFVILHINLPEAYITAAEEKLEKEIIKYMKENNDEKFTFSIKFSRIYLAENPDVASAINENTLLNVKYNEHTYPLYVSSYSYKMSSSEALPEITVELKDEITVNQNALQNAISEVKGDFQTAFKNLDIFSICGPYFLRKDADDRSSGKISASMGFEAGGYVKSRSGAKIDEYGQAEVENINARGGVISNEFVTQDYVSGILGSGAKLWIDENNKANLEVDNITARESFKVTELVIQKVNSVGGVLVVSATNGVIENVEAIYKQNSNNENTLDVDYYEVTFGTDSSFQNNDIIRCSYWDNTTKELRSYWYPIVVSPTNATSNVVQVPYGNLPTNNGTPIIPKVGDKVAQIGNTTNNKRQGVIVISTESNKPYISIYDGLNTPSLDASKLRGRFGDLSGLTFNGKDLDGYGIWSNNAYLNGEFHLLSSGKSIEDALINQSGVGRNLLLGTNKGVGNWKFNSSLIKSSYNPYTMLEIDYNGAKGVQMKNLSDGSATYEIIYFSLRPQFIKKDKTYHLSFDLMQTANNNVEIDFSVSLSKSDSSNSLNNPIHVSSKDVGGIWRHYNVEFNAIADGEENGGQVVYFSIRPNAREWLDFAIVNLQLEEGIVATAWSSAPEDSMNDISNLTSEYNSYVEATAENFLSVQTRIDKVEAGRNLLLKSDTPINSNKYMMGTYNMGYVKPNKGDIVTLSFIANVADERIKNFRVFNSGGLMPVQNSIPITEYNTDVYISTTFTWRINDTDGNTHINLYQTDADLKAVADLAGNTKIYDIKLEFGDIASAWSIAPEETDSYYESRIKQTAESIELSVKNGLTKTGIDITEGNIVAKTQNFEIQNQNGNTTARINAEGLIEGTSGFATTYPIVGAPAPYINKLDEKLTFYHMSGNKALEIGIDNNTNSFIRVYDENGNMTWKLGTEAKFLTDETTITYSPLNLIRYTSVAEIPEPTAGQNLTDGARNYYKEQSNLDTNGIVRLEANADSSSIPDGIYALAGYPTPVRVPANNGGIELKYRRTYYVMKDGRIILTSYVGYVDKVE